MEFNKSHVLIAGCKLGRNLLESGAEIYRVEESINFFFRAYGIADPQIFVIPSSIMVSILEEGKPLTRIERVKSTTQDLYKLDRFNNLCRSACKDIPTIEYIMAEMDSIKSTKAYSFAINLIALGMGAAFFCLFWGGTVLDGFVAFVCGIATKYVLRVMGHFKTNIFFSNLVASSVIAYIALAFVSIGVAQNYDKIIIGSIMLLVPGVAITNVMRDILAGDLITGTTKLAEALLVATAIAIGIAIAMYSVLLLGGIL